MGTLTSDELKRRAEGLLALGNPPARIRQILAVLGATPAEIDAAMMDLEAHLRQKSQADARWVAVVGGAVIVIVLGLVGAAIWLNPAPAATPAPTAGPGTVLPPTRAGTLPPIQQQAQTLLPGIPPELVPNEIPTNIPPNFMLATPAVVQGSGSGVGRSKCPANQIEAAEIFGGDAADWAFDQATNGWTMTRVGTAVTIQVPADMAAGFLVITDKPEMRSVDGPARIDNINFIAISCP